MTNTYGLTRSNIGPLPASFSPAPSCVTPWIPRDSGVAAFGFPYAMSCSTTTSAEPHQIYDPACYPPGWANEGYAVLDMPFYSPASICPTGFTSACNVTRNVFDVIPGSLTFGANAHDQLLYGMTDGETAVGCCPTGFQCGDTWLLSCTSVATLGEVITGVDYGRSCIPTPVTFMATATPFVGAANSYLKVLILYNSAKDNSSSSSGTHSPGLSTGAKIGLGVAIPLGVILVAAISFALWIRHRKLQKEKFEQSQRKGQLPGNEPVLPPHLAKPELEGSKGGVLGGSAGKSARPKAELDTKAAVIERERAARETQIHGQARHEMDGKSTATITNFAELSSDPYGRHELDSGDTPTQKIQEV